MVLRQNKVFSKITTMSLDLEFVNCNLCGRDQFDNYLTRIDLNLSIQGDFQLVRCRYCGLVYQNPRPAQNSINEIYPDNYDQFIKSSTEESSIINRIDRGYGLKKRIKSITRYKKPGRLLDIGCATGDFLEMMRDIAGWDVYGIEPSSHASDYARTHLGLQVKTGFLGEADYEAENFDVITMWNVLEHLVDPINTLKQIHKLLKPDGMLIFNTPNLDSLDARIFGPYWIGFELPRHFFVFSRRTLMLMLHDAGFRIIETRSIYGSHSAFMSSIRFWLRDQPISPNIRNLFESLLFSRILRAITLPYFFIADKLNLSTTPTDFCIKIDSESQDHRSCI